MKLRISLYFEWLLVNIFDIKFFKSKTKIAK